MEEDINERRHEWKTTSIEEIYNGRQPQWTINLNGNQYPLTKPHPTLTKFYFNQKNQTKSTHLDLTL